VYLLVFLIQLYELKVGWKRIIFLRVLFPVLVAAIIGWKVLKKWEYIFF